MNNEKPKWSRKRWCAEWIGDSEGLDRYQQSLEGPERRLPIYDNGTLRVVQLPGDSPTKLAAALEGRTWKAKPHWRDPSVIIHTEIP